MSEWCTDPGWVRTQTALATAGNAYGPQFGPANPPEYYYEPRQLECGHSEEDCDGRECGYPGEVPADYDDRLGENT